MRSLSSLLALALALLTPAAARATAEDDLAALRDRVAADVREGRPLVAQVHVALCSNDQIRCGGRGLGDGDSLARNLYWATTGGASGWFGRRGSGWTEVALADGERDAIRAERAGAVLEVKVWRREVAAGEPWRRRGVRATLPVFVVVYAWRGARIDDAIAAYASDLFGSAERVVRLADGRSLRVGGGAQIVAYQGHSRWMDLHSFRWPTNDSAALAKGTIAVACMTRQYIADDIASPRRVPLLLTRDLVFAGSMPLDGALRAFAAGASLAGIREEAVRAYAIEEKKPFGHVASVFTNPSDRRWTRPD